MARSFIPSPWEGFPRTLIVYALAAIVAPVLFTLGQIYSSTKPLPLSQQGLPPEHPAPVEMIIPPMHPRSDPSEYSNISLLAAHDAAKLVKVPDLRSDSGSRFVGTKSAEPRRLALVVGIGAYQHLPALPNTVADARLIADKLRATGFDVDLETDIGKDALARAVRDFIQKIGDAGPRAVSAFYYSGHGLHDNRKSNYLLGADADVKSQDGLPLQGLSLTSALGAFEAAHSAATLVLLDVYREGPLLATGEGVKGGLGIEEERRGLLIAFSTEPGQSADDGPLGGHSPFAAALAAELDVPGLESVALFKVVTKKVMDATHGEQFPWVTSRLTGDFFFRPPDASAAARVAPGAKPGSQPDAAEVAYGEAVVANTTEGYETWLRTYPDHERKTSVLALLQRLREDELWQRANTAPTTQEQMQALEFELMAFPNGIYAEKARTRLAALQQPSPAPMPTVPAPEPQPAAPGVQRYAGKDAYGNDRGGFVPGVANVDTCEAMCRADSGCAGYTYNIRRQSCILKNAIGILVDAREPAITGVLPGREQSPRSGSVNRATFRRYEETDAPNNDLLGFLSGMDIQACESFCVSRADCVGYTYNRKRSVCIPKSRIGRLARSREPTVTGILESRQ